LKVQSMGYGVQSVTLSAMACLGDIPMPDYALFADPGWESAATYAYKAWFETWAKERGLEIAAVSTGNLREDAIANKRGAQMPLYSKGRKEVMRYCAEENPECDRGFMDSMSWYCPGHGTGVFEMAENGMLNRQCTSEYKIKPIRNEIKRRLGVSSGSEVKEPVTLLLGISLDEAIRMKDSPLGWIRHEYPLVDKRMTRGDCERYLDAHKIPRPPKSACIGCPFRSDEAWKALSPEEMKDAVELDEKIRTRAGMDSQFFLHAQRVPLSQVVFDKTPDMFGNECEGHCGL
jgi:hypothetical protein